MPALKSRVLSTTSSPSNYKVNDPSSDLSVTPLLTTLRLQISCIAATLTAATIFTLTEHDDHQHSWWCAFEVSMQALLVVVGTAYFRTRTRLFPDSSLLLPPILMVAAFSLLCEPIQRLFFDHGHSFEVLVMHSQCNLMLALAVCGFRLPFQRLAMVIAVFLTIFCCTISNASGLVPLTILFCAACVLWLVALWWETVDCRLVSHEPRRRSAFWIVVATVLPVLLLIPGLGFGNNTVTTALKGFMPSSGGSGAYDPFSRGGVNDGDALVAGHENIKSFAPLDDAPFLDSDKPSLYDVFNDQFDEPPKKIKDQQRAVALPADLMKHVHQKVAEAKQAGREFSLIRGEPKIDRRPINDLDSPAAFYVAGRVPARFRMEVYEYFDGVVWYPLDGQGSQEDQPTLRTKIRQIDGQHWLQIPPTGRAFEIQNGSVTHSLKVANLKGNVIPSPPQLVGVNIEHVNRDDMYSVSENVIAELCRKSIPEMTPINMVSEYVNRDRLADVSALAMVSPAHRVVRFLPDHEGTAAIRRLAKDWTSGLPRGWQQIAAIESQLRKYCVLDRDAKIAARSEFPVADFLLKTRRGPEYLFAASAACLLRSLDYPARMVSGFYADEANYDSRKQHTVVFAENAHFWCEVEIGMNTWITIEASPGYEIAQPPPGFLTRVWNLVFEAGRLVLQNATRLVMALAVLALLIVYRSFLVDAALTLKWKLAVKLSPKQRAIELGALVQRRLELARLKKDPGATLKRWARRDDLSAVRQELERVADLSNQALFGDEIQRLFDQKELEDLAAFLSYRKFRSLTRHQKNNTTQSIEILRA